MFSLFNFSFIFPGGQLTPFAPMCRRPWQSPIEVYSSLCNMQYWWSYRRMASTSESLCSYWRWTFWKLDLNFNRRCVIYRMCRLRVVFLNLTQHKAKISKNFTYNVNENSATPSAQSLHFCEIFWYLSTVARGIFMLQQYGVCVISVSAYQPISLRLLIITLNPDFSLCSTQTMCLS